MLNKEKNQLVASVLDKGYEIILEPCQGGIRGKLIKESYTATVVDKTWHDALVRVAAQLVTTPPFENGGFSENA